MIPCRIFTSVMRRTACRQACLVLAFDGAIFLKVDAMIDVRQAGSMFGEVTVTPPERFQVEFEPPIPIDADAFRDRDEQLASLIAEKVVPKLIALHGSFPISPISDSIHAGEREIGELSRLILGPDNADAMDYITGLRESGLSLDRLYLELLEPAARYLGELWDADKVDFLDVSIGLIRLQRLVRAFAGLDDVAPYSGKCRALIISTPDEQHLFGSAIVQRFFRAAGWHVCNGPVATVKDISNIVSREWFGVVGFSLSTQRHMDHLAASIAVARTSSLNPSIGIMVGGPVFSADPELAGRLGADGTAANAPAAVVLAKTLLTRSLVAAD